MATNKAVPQTGEAMIVCLSPDVCKSPKDPVPYQTFAKYSKQVQVSGNVFINGVPACNKLSRTSGVEGNAEGSGGGVKSGVFMGGGWARPASGQAPGLHVNGAECLRHDDIHELNCAGPEGPANTKGKSVYAAGGGPQAGVGADGCIAGDTNPALTSDPAALDSASSVGTGDMDVSETLGSASNEVASGGSSSLGSSLFGGDLGSALSKGVTSPALLNTAAKFAASGGDPKALMGLVGPLLGAAGISGPLVGPAVSMLGGVVSGQNPLLAAAGAVLQGAGIPAYITSPAIGYINQAIARKDAPSGGGDPSQQSAALLASATTGSPQGDAQQGAAQIASATGGSQQGSSQFSSAPSGSGSGTSTTLVLEDSDGDGTDEEQARQAALQSASAPTGSSSGGPTTTLVIEDENTLVDSDAAEA